MSTDTHALAERIEPTEAEIEAALAAYNQVWKEASDIDASTVDAVRRTAIIAALSSRPLMDARSTLERGDEIEADFYRLKAQEWACETAEAELRVRAAISSRPAPVAEVTEFSSAERDVIENMRADFTAGRKIMASDAQVALRIIDRTKALATPSPDAGLETSHVEGRTYITKAGTDHVVAELTGEWFPISTAPKTGELIETIYLSDDPKKVRWMISADKGTGWYVGGYDGLRLTYEPTHWMATPSPDAGRVSDGWQQLRESYDHVKRLHDLCVTKALNPKKMPPAHYTDQAIGLSHAMDILHNALATSEGEGRAAQNDAATWKHAHRDSSRIAELAEIRANELAALMAEAVKALEQIANFSLQPVQLARATLAKLKATTGQE